MLASSILWTHQRVWAVLAMLVLVQGRRRVAAAVLGAVFLIGPMWFTPRGHLVELKDNWWQAAACASYVVIGLAYLIFFAASRQRSETHGRPPDHRPNG